MSIKVESVPAPASVALPSSSTPAESGNQRLMVFLAMAAVYIIWGSTYLAMRFAVESFPPFMMTGARFLTAGGILFLLQLVRGQAMPTRIQVRNAVIIGSLMLGIGTGGVAFAEQWVESGLAALAVAAVPVWTALFAGFWGRFPNRAEWIGLAVGLSGVALLNMENGLQANPLGALALLIGPICWSFGSMLSRQVKLPSGLMATAVEMLGGGAFLMIISLINREPFPTHVSTGSLLAFAYLVIVGALIAFNAYIYLLNNVRPVLATSYAYVNPVVAVILGVLLAGETITGLGIVAMIIILSGVAILAFSRQTSKA